MTTRLEIHFPSQGERCAAWLYLPQGARPAPIIVMAHGLGGVRQMRLDSFAERFQAAGYACLVFDYRHFGGSDGTPRQLLDVGKQQADWRAAVEFARGLAQVDGRRVVVWGTSFGGGHAVHAGATVEGVSAVIAQCLFTDGLASGLAMNPITSLRVLPLAIADQLLAWAGAKPIMVDTSGAPCSAALMTAHDCLDGYLKLVPRGLPFQNRVAARAALQIMAYRPGKLASQLPCPALFCVCEHDTVAPTRSTLRHVRKAPRGEVKVYGEGHFGVYVGKGFEKVVADQIEFLHRHVPIAIQEST
ncbi:MULTISPECIES: alpha/beta hydrolase [unclassified Duganella]|uniref:alpha/beta hydrolase n=1 Tax=unclassified Duganella TaxID=2636909 RepID=UPI0006F2875F|nr:MULTISPECIES: alpha/beta hydrolase [unclassified Duganella]KQV61563.1 alpha/beta hydrolase [Duganella sp. Root336D2]KQZ28278.1 alpha/beta hydrolase [Duganella sp. Root1480D1]